ncbi:hypothetical protein [Parasitella parasitica]|uniref:Uncharacterized protein n=1 Tax=Parasitella parasitica TaxID=35722 RepID=A0A0B7MTA6_9FUNG|nr:hypothetical protein [Parasitella parasitica]
MLLVQPLKIDDINIVIKDDEDETEQQPQLQQAQSTVQLPPAPPQAQISLPPPHLPPNALSPSPIDLIDDDELLAILGLPVSSVSSSATSTTVNSPVNESSLLDWEDMPELSEGEEDYSFSVADLTLQVPPTNKRKFDDDIFAQYDFVEANPFTKRLCKQQQLPQNPFLQPC